MAIRPVIGPDRPAVEGLSRFVDTHHRVAERADEWGVLLSVQTVDSSPVGADPLDAAGDLGGITASANMAEPVTCAVVMLLDHGVDVI